MVWPPKDAHSLTPPKTVASLPHGAMEILHPKHPCEKDRGVREKDVMKETEVRIMQHLALKIVGKTTSKGMQTDFGGRNKKENMLFPGFPRRNIFANTLILAP